MSHTMTLQRSLHILGPMLGHRLGVKVRIGGSQACTNGAEIRLPALPPCSEEAAILGFGHLFHESNHVRETDFSAMDAQGTLHTLINSLEDIRVDRLGFQCYPGGHRDREALVRLLLDSGRLQPVDAQSPPARVLESYLFWRLEHEVLGLEAAATLAVASEAAFHALFPQGVATRLDGLMFGIDRCDSTADVVALARRIKATLEDEASPPEQETTPSSARDAGDAQDAHANGEAPPAAAGPDDAARRREALQRALSADGEVHMDDLGQVTAQALEEQAGESGYDGIGLPTATAARASRAHAGAPERFMNDAKQATNALRHRIAGLLQARSRVRRGHATQGHRIDGHRLASTAVGEVRLFRTEVVSERLDTRIAVLIDRSGSMQGDPIAMAAEAGFAMGLSMQGLAGVDIAMAAFPGYGHSDVLELTSFGQRIDRCSGVFAALGTEGDTPLREALLWGGARLLAQRCSRRILLTLTDGAYPEPLGRPVVDALQRGGIECAAIGIACQVDHLFEVSRRIDNIHGLSTAVFDVMLQMLRAPARH